MRFDVSIDLTDALLPPGMLPAEAVEKARSAVQALPGAGWVSVDAARGAPPWLPWVVAYEPGRSAAMEGGEWEGVRDRMRSAVKAALA